MAYNHSDEPKEVVVLPDARIDLFLSKPEAIPFCIKLLGFGKNPIQAFSGKTEIYSVFPLLGLFCRTS